MHIILFLICVATLFACAKECLRANNLRPELILIALASLFLAYPVKNLALAYLKFDFMTFDFFGGASYWVYINYIIFMTIFWLVLHQNVLKAPQRRADQSVEQRVLSPELRVVALALLIANSLYLFWTVYEVTSGQLTSLLFTSDARKAFLLNQQGQGWVSLLVFFSFPLIVMQPRSAIRNPIVIGCAMMTFLALSAIGSRLFLFGYVICIIIRFYRITPLIAAIMFISFVIFGALIYMSFSGDAAENSAYHGLIYFMRTFDGADIFNGYLESSQRIYYGTTILNDIFVTYIPRVLFASKPFNFGSIVITGDVYPEFIDVQTLGATYPPGLLLEAYANFWLLCPLLHFVVVRFLVFLSRRERVASPYNHAMYVSAAATAATIFRGFGPYLVSLMAYAIVLGLMYLLTLPFKTTGRSAARA